MTVTEIKTLKEFREIIKTEREVKNENGELVKEDLGPVIVDFWAPWCGPCKQMSPLFEKIANNPENAGLRFYKIDGDENDGALQEVSVTTLPSFIVFHKNEKIGEVLGAVPSALMTLITKHAKANAPAAAPAAEAPAAPAEKL
ncbi:thioredoxin-like protein [Mycena galopus ATCC 62051]|nr:thioredoxin-like protein [Mycena galopus ATCC 62051]